MSYRIPIPRRTAALLLAAPIALVSVAGCGVGPENDPEPLPPPSTSSPALGDLPPSN